MDNRRKKFLLTTEGIVFICGLMLLVNTVVVFSFTSVVGSELMQKILSMIAMDMFSGLQSGIYFGIVAGIPLPAVVLISTLYNLIFMSLLYPIITFFYEKVVEMRFVGKAVRKTHAIAQKNLSKVEKYGVIGVGFFIWLPFYMTGPLVGALIGYLLGIRTLLVILTTVISTALGAITWALLFDQLVDLTRSIGNTIPAISVGAIVLATLYMKIRKSIKNRIASRKNRED